MLGKIYHNSKLDKRLIPLLKYTNPTKYENIVKEVLPDEYGNKYYCAETGKWNPAKEACEQSKRKTRKSIIEENRIARNNKRADKIKFQKEFDYLKPKIIKRDGYRCVKCKSQINLHVHHVVYRSNGGTNDFENLITVCAECHAEIHKGEAIHKALSKGVKNECTDLRTSTNRAKPQKLC